MRIIAGQMRGRKLLDLKDVNFRPTTDRNKEALFNILTVGKVVKETDFDLVDATILDICCGSGAIAFEALSRGAKSATLVDNSHQHLALAKKNAETLKVAEKCHFILGDAKFSLSDNDEPFDLVFIDPPYSEDYSAIIKNLIKRGWISQRSLIVIEAPANGDVEDNLEDLDVLEVRKYGISKFIFAKK